MLYKPRTESQEFGQAKKNFRQCRDCGAVYSDKAWHPDSPAKESATFGQQLFMTRCPACQMVANRQYEGVVIIQDIPQQYRHELLHMIRGFGVRAYAQDCQHRIIEIRQEENDKWVVTTTENQLAVRLAKKIREVFDKVQVRTAHSRQPDDVVRLWVRFKPYLSPLKFSQDSWNHY